MSLVVIKEGGVYITSSAHLVGLKDLDEFELLGEVEPVFFLHDSGDGVGEMNGEGVCGSSKGLGDHLIEAVHRGNY